MLLMGLGYRGEVEGEFGEELVVEAAEPVVEAALQGLEDVTVFILRLLII